MLYAATIKRLSDLLSATALLLLLLPLFAFVWLVVRCSLGPPVFFFDKRAGKDGRPFSLVKFRTMTNARGADGQLLPDAERLTGLGRFLRRLSLDELPQLLSVIVGDMSMVGPRPLPLRYIERYSPRQAQRLLVRPGLTGWAQIHGRNELGWPERLERDAEYVDMLGRWYGPFLDIYIVICTICLVAWQALTGRGIASPGSATMQEFAGNE
jgi:lipopolysaccharide/colanic/teichoic acid biosynthesis glycosyltransferase